MCTYSVLLICWFSACFRCFFPLVGIALPFLCNNIVTRQTHSNSTSFALSIFFPSFFPIISSHGWVPSSRRGAEDAQGAEDAKGTGNTVSKERAREAVALALLKFQLFSSYPQDEPETPAPKKGKRKASAERACKSGISPSFSALPCCFSLMTLTGDFTPRITLPVSIWHH